jgi:hypothetical protein
MVEYSKHKVLQMKTINHPKATNNTIKKDKAYEEWLDKNSSEIRNSDINDMERVFCNSIILKNYQQPLNNFNYNPLQGA